MNKMTTLQIILVVIQLNQINNGFSDPCRSDAFLIKKGVEKTGLFTNVRRNSDKERIDRPMSVFSDKFRKSVKKAVAWSLSAMTALSCAAALPVITSTPVSAAASTLSNEDRGVIFANTRTDFRDESIYFLITTRFYDGDSTNNTSTSEDVKAKNLPDDPSWRGDFAGLIQKLDYIKALGFTAIWITPVVENNSGYDYHGYHAYDFSAVDKRYESNGVTYQTLIDACHEKGIKIIQDVVFNHTCNWGEKNLLKITDEKYAGGRSEMTTANGKSMDPENIYHHFGFCGGGDWDNYNVQIMTLHDDCFDLNTECPKVYNYLIDCYNNYINMGVDAFRVDTVKHISRLTLNKTFVPAFKQTGGDKFYMFGEVCTKGHETWYRGAPPISCAFYTWADDDSWLSKWTTDPDTNVALTEQHYNAHSDTGSQPTSKNAFLNGNDYHTPDYSQRSGMDVIDFQMHWSFSNANSAFQTALGEDPYFNDSTWNVVYVDSHDYAPDECNSVRYTFGTDAWAENLSLMFTFRGIPCIFYGSEIEFQAGKPIDVGPNSPLSETGRAYYGDKIEGEINASDFTVYTASGNAKTTLESTLSQHIMRLNRIRQAVPALRKGQYSTEGCSGSSGLAFKRRYTDANTDSFALVTISGSATFSGIPNGTYVDAVTGDSQTVSGGTLTANCSGKGNMRVYVLDTAKTPAPGRVIPNGSYLGDGGASSVIGGEAVDIVKIPATDISVNKTTVTVLEAESETVTATVSPSNATNKTVTWSSSDTSVATVSGGVIKGVSAGSATITAATSNGLKATVKVTVKANSSIVKPTGVTVSPSTLKLKAGASGSLTATVAPSTATDKSVTWKSSNDKVASVDGSGNVTAVGEGTATITATTSNGLSSTATVTVEGASVTYIENGVYFEKPSDWGNGINVYIYDSATDSATGAVWPGSAMKSAGGNVYYYEFSPASSTIKVIFNDGNNQVPASQQPGFDFVNRGYYTTAGYQKTIEKQTTVDVTSVSLDKTSASVNVGSTVKLTATVAPSNATDPTITWSSSNTSVATVSNGTVTGKSAGTATIKATSSNGKSAQATITVKSTTTTSDLKNSSSISATSVTKGTKVTLKGAASGGTSPYQYAFYAKNSSATYYSTIKDYSTSATAYYTPSAAGTFNIQIRVKDAKNNMVAKYFTLKVTASSTTTKLSNNSTISATSIPAGSSVTVTGYASGGTSPYQYAFYYKKSSSTYFTTVKSYSSTRTAKITPSGTGTYNVRAYVKDSKGTTAIKSFNVYVTKGVLTNKSTVSATTTTLGKSITITGTAAGGTSPYQYASWYKHSTASSYTAIRGYSSTRTMTFKPAHSGKYTLLVRVKDNVGTVISKTFTITVNPGPLTSSTKVSATSITLGNSVTITNAATGGKYPYKYAAYYKKSTSQYYTTLKDFTTTKTFTFKPASAGTWNLRTKVKDASGKIVVKNFNIYVTAPLANKSTISATKITLGNSVKVTATATGGKSPYKYAGYMKKSTATKYTEFRAASTTRTMYAKPAATGVYNLRIKVKDAAGKVVSKDFKVTVTAALANKSTLSATSITLGKSIMLNCAATGGTAPYQYAASYKNTTTGSAYKLLRGYSTYNKMAFKPTTAGTYTVLIKVKDKAGKVVVKTFTLKVTKPAALTNKSTISKTSITFGSSVTVKCAATGGKASYTYEIAYKKASKDSYSVVQSFSSDTSIQITPGARTTYDIRVRVKDKAGTVKSKFFTLTVK